MRLAYRMVAGKLVIDRKSVTTSTIRLREHFSSEIVAESFPDSRKSRHILALFRPISYCLC